MLIRRAFSTKMTFEQIKASMPTKSKPFVPAARLEQKDSHAK